MVLSYNLIETRQVSGLGSINVESGAPPGGARVDLILFDLIRPASNRYRNLEWFPPRERIANLTFRRSGIVVKREVVEFERQMFYEYPDPGGQVLVAVQCAYKGILQTFVNLGNALALVPISVVNEIGEYSRFETEFDQIVIKCYADAAVSVSLYQLLYEVCGDDSGLFQFPSDLPPAPAQTPPGDPITPSDPYDPNNPSEPYAPSPLDLPPDPCIGIGLWQVDFFASPGGNLTFYTAGSATDLLAVTNDPVAGCPNPAQLTINGVVSEPNLSCFAALSNFTFIYLGQVPLPPGGQYLQNDVYPECQT